MIEYIREVLDVGIDHPAPPSTDFLPEAIQRLLRGSLWPVPIRAVKEVRFEDRLEDELRRRVHNPIPNGRDA
jgi:hypothetical protein